MITFDDVLHSLCNYYWYAYVEKASVKIPTKYINVTYKEKQAYIMQKYKDFIKLNWFEYTDNKRINVEWSKKGRSLKRVKDKLGLSADGFWVYCDDLHGSYTLIKFEENEKKEAWCFYRTLKEYTKKFLILFVNGFNGKVVPNGVMPPKPFGRVKVETLLELVSRKEIKSRKNVKPEDFEKEVKDYIYRVMDFKYKITVTDTGIVGHYGRVANNKKALKTTVRKGYWVYEYFTTIDDYAFKHFEDKDEALEFYEIEKKKIPTLDFVVAVEFFEVL